MANNLPKTKKSNFYFQTEQEAIRALEIEGRKLQRIAVKVWRKYLSSYQPKKYIRTNNTERGIKLGKVKMIAPDQWGIELTFENDLMYHESVFDKQNGTRNYPKGHSIMLLSGGWKAVKLERKIGIRQNFTRHRGINYLGQVVRAYNLQKHKGITLDIQWSGKFLKK
ncbi:hypothetical protein ABDI04_05530 [Bacillus licheniformis]